MSNTIILDTLATYPYTKYTYHLNVYREHVLHTVTRKPCTYVTYAYNGYTCQIQVLCVHVPQTRKTAIYLYHIIMRVYCTFLVSYMCNGYMCQTRLHAYTDKRTGYTHELWYCRPARYGRVYFYNSKTMAGIARAHTRHRVRNADQDDHYVHSDII